MFSIIAIHQSLSHSLFPLLSTAGEAEPEVAPPPPVDITTSYLISTEDVLAKGISEDDVERFK